MEELNNVFSGTIVAEIAIIPWILSIVLPVTYLMKLKEVPIWLLFFAFVLLFSGILLLIFNNINPGDFVLILTLIVLIFYTYYTYKLAEEAKKSAYISANYPEFLLTKERHTIDLKEFLDDWLRVLTISFEDYKRYPNTNSKPYKKYSFARLEGDWRFEDHMNYHLEGEYKNLRSKWVLFKDKVNKNEDMYCKLSKKLKENAKSDTGLTFCKYYKENNIITEAYIKRIYIQYINQEEKEIMDLNIDESREKETYFVLTQANEIIAKGTREEMDKARKVFEEMMSNPTCFEKYVDEIKQIKKLDDEIEKLQDELRNMIAKLKGYPFLPGDGCDILNKNI